MVLSRRELHEQDKSIDVDELRKRIAKDNSVNHRYRQRKFVSPDTLYMYEQILYQKGIHYPLDNNAFKICLNRYRSLGGHMKFKNSKEIK